MPKDFFVGKEIFLDETPVHISDKLITIQLAAILMIKIVVKGNIEVILLQDKLFEIIYRDVFVQTQHKYSASCRFCYKVLQGSLPHPIKTGYPTGYGMDYIILSGIRNYESTVRHPLAIFKC